MNCNKRKKKFHHVYHNHRVVDGKRLSEVRIAAGKSLDEVAAACGCNRSSVSRWEQGKLTPSEERIAAMIKFLGTDVFVVENTNKLEG